MGTRLLVCMQYNITKWQFFTYGLAATIVVNESFIDSSEVEAMKYAVGL